MVLRRIPRVALFFVATAMLAALFFGVSRGQDAAGWAKQHSGELVELYREFHRQPELSFEEHQTAARMAKALKAAGLDVTDGVAKTGIVALLKNGSGPTVMIRTDLDALPVTEQTGLAYASTVKVKGESGEMGVMHACGHDIHMTSLIGTARWFVEHKSLWKGTLFFLGQPAEERVGGAKVMRPRARWEFAVGMRWRMSIVATSR
jgi:metal-dependent amidase/aminoacylase/carboxypeptidase family protein